VPQQVNTGKPRSSQTVTSPSIRHDVTWSTVRAAATAG
jgi:hypothetical protein